MGKKLAIYCDCDSDSGMLTYTLMLLTALKTHTEIKSLVLTSAARTVDEQERLKKLQNAGDEMIVISRAYPSAIEAARAMAKIIIRENVDFYIPNYRYMPHLVLTFLPRKIKNIIVVHNHAEEIYHSIRFYKSAIDGVIFPSSTAFSTCESNIPFSLQKICIPHYFSPLGPVDTTARDSGKLVIVYHGRLAHAQKKSLELLNIAVELNKLGVEFTLKLIGAGDALEDIREKILRESIQNVEILGQLSREALYSQLSSADIELSTSVYEGFCYSVAEAMSLGAVPVVYDNDVLRDLIQDGVNGYLRPWGRADQVAITIKTLACNRDKLYAMKCSAIDSVAALLSASRYADQMNNFLQSVHVLPDGDSWPILRPRGLAYDTITSKLIAKIGSRLNFW